jgi:hypothetical protein
MGAHAEDLVTQVSRVDFEILDISKPPKRILIHKDQRDHNFLLSRRVLPTGGVEYAVERVSKIQAQAYSAHTHSSGSLFTEEPSPDARNEKSDQFFELLNKLAENKEAADFEDLMNQMEVAKNQTESGKNLQIYQASRKVAAFLAVGLTGYYYAMAPILPAPFPDLQPNTIFGLGGFAFAYWMMRSPGFESTFKDLTTSATRLPSTTRAIVTGALAGAGSVTCAQLIAVLASKVF